MSLGLGSPRPGRRSLRAETPKVWKKVSKKSSEPRAPKVWKKSRGESEKSRKSRFWGFSNSPRDFFQTLGARGSEDFSRLFSDFWGFGPETPPLPGRGDPNSRDTQPVSWGFSEILCFSWCAMPLLLCIRRIIVNPRWGGCAINLKIVQKSCNNILLNCFREVSAYFREVSAYFWEVSAYFCLESVHIFGELVHIFAWKLVSKQNSKQVSRKWHRGFTMILIFIRRVCARLPKYHASLVAPYRAIPRYYRCDTPYRAIFFQGGQLSPKWCDTPPWYWVSHRHICAIPHFATYRAIIVRYHINHARNTFAILSLQVSCDMKSIAAGALSTRECWTQCIRFAKPRLMFQINFRAHKSKIGTLPPPKKTQKTPPPPKTRNFMDMGFFPAERTHFFQASIELAQPFPAPELRTRISRTLKGFFWKVLPRFFWCVSKDF